MCDSIGSVATNFYRGSRYRQIPYRVFVSLGQSDQTVLLDAQRALVLENPQALCHISAASELWTFCLSGKESDTPPAPESRFDLKETAAGLLLPATLAAATELPLPYIPLISAIRDLANRTLVLQLGYMPFGSQVISQAGKRIFVEPSLLATGDVYFNLYQTSLVLIPCQTSATLVEHLKTPPTTALRLLALLETNFNVAMPRGLFLDHWVLVRTPQNLIIPWPWALCLVGPSPGSWKVPDFEPEYDDVLKSAADIMLQVRVEGDRAATARAPEPTFPAAISSNQGNNLAGSAMVYPTPPDPQQHQSTARVPPPAHATPQDTTLIRSDPVADRTSVEPVWNLVNEDLFGEDEEITEADFSFFDQDSENVMANEEISLEPVPEVKTESPGADQQAQVGKKRPAEESEEDRVSKKIILANTIKINALSASDGRNVFSPIHFDPVISQGLDSKYSSGGRYFMPKPVFSSDEEDDSGDNEDDFQDPEDAGVVRTTARSESSPLKSEQDRTEEDRPEERNYLPEWTTVVSEKILFKAPRPKVKLDGTDEENSATVQLLMELRVWDNGALDDLVHTQSPFEELDSRSLKQLQALFPLDGLLLNEIVEQLHVGVESEVVSSTPASGPPSQDATTTADNGDEEDAKDAKPGIVKPTVVSARPSPAPAPPPIPPTALLPKVNSYVTAIIPDIRFYQAVKAALIYQVPAAFVSVRRAGTAIKARAPILRFWKVLGLSPHHGPKDSHVVTLAPQGRGLQSAVKFLQCTLQNAYEECGLGTLSLFTDDYGSDLGMVPFNPAADVAQIADTFKALRIVDLLKGPTQAKVENGQNTQQIPLQNVAFLVVNPYRDLPSVLKLLRVCVQLREMLPSPLTASFAFINQSVISGPKTVTALSSYQMVRLALSLYDRTLPSQSSSARRPAPKQMAKALAYSRQWPSFTLAKVKPMKINFRVTAQPPERILDEDSLLHVAYCLSSDHKWVCYCLTDQWGSLSRVEALRLDGVVATGVGTSSSDAGVRSKTLEDVFVEIWERAHQMAKALPVRWRAIVCRLGSIHEDELTIWRRVSESTPDVLPHTHILALDASWTAVLKAGESVYPHVPSPMANTSTPTGSSWTAAAAYGKRSPRDPQVVHTPATPRVSMDVESPDVASATSVLTPSSGGGTADAMETDETVVDVQDSAFAVLFTEKSLVGMTSRSAPSHVKPLMRAALLKPAVQPDSDQQRVYELSLVHGAAPYDGFIKTMIVNYRRLATLGGYSMVTPEDATLLPWHVEAVRKMMDVLEYIE